MKIRSYRRGVAWLLVSLYLLLPFVKIGGESAFRFDVPTLRLHFLGTVIWMQDFFVILLLAFFVILLFFFLTLVFGRVWCGWACLQTVYCDLTGFMDHLAKKRLVTKVASHLGMLGISIILGFIAVCYFVSPYELLPKALSLTLAPIPAGCGLALAFIFYLNFSFVRRTFCATICPYAMLQVMIVDAKSLIIKMDPEREEECIGCKLCVRRCPTGMDIRQGMRGNCIMCAECIDACNTALSRKEKKGLIGYRFGTAGKASIKQLMRPAALAVGAATVVLFTALIYQSAYRPLFDFSILPHPMEARFTKTGEALNAYILSVKNKGPEDISLLLELGDPGDGVRFNPSIMDEMVVPAGLVEKFPLFVRARGNLNGDQKIQIYISDKANSEKKLRKSVYFIMPSKQG
jgi:cytochrome c oxidase accessory protein FixG